MSWILLDSQSTVNISTNPELLRNIRGAMGEMMIHSHIGSRSTKQVGDLPGYPDPIWYDPNGIANILSLSSVRKLFRITFDSDKGNVFKVHIRDKVVEFKQSKEGLYFHDVRMNGSVFTLTHKSKERTCSRNGPGQSYNQVTTVRENKKFYTRRDVRRAEEARKLQRVLQFPTSRHL